MESGGRSASRRSQHPLINTTLAAHEDDDLETLPLPTTTPVRSVTPSFPSPSTLPFKSFPAPRDLLPSFLQADVSPRSRPPPRPTAWVDGLRGIAAFLVLIFHFTYRMTNTNLAFGADESPFAQVWWRLPIVRLITSGSAMVALFFLISGYALSYRPLQLIRSAQTHHGETGRINTDAYARHLGSAIIRRPIRLFAPVILASLLIFVLVQLRLYDITRSIAENAHIFPVVPQETHVETKSNILVQLAHLYGQLRDLIHNSFWENFFGGNFDYDQHTWTIPVELRSSFLLFGSLLPCIAMAESWRFWYWIALTIWCLDGGNWQMTLFYSGALIAEWNLGKAAQIDAEPHKAEGVTAPTTSPPEMPLLVMLSLLVLSYPEEHAATTPLYRYLTWLTPSSFGQDFRFWQCLGGGVLFATISASPVLKRPLESRVVQYLGSISYGLYLMHGPVIHVVGFATLGALHSEGQEGVSAVQYIVAFVVTVCCAIWAGDLWWRGVDARAVAWARQMSDRILVR